MIESYIQKGEAVLVYTEVDFNERLLQVQQSLGVHADVVLCAEEKMKIETIRDFVYGMQKESTGGVYGVAKVGVLLCDDIAHPAQHALLKVLEDIQSDTCILIYAHTHSVFMSTVLSRVMQIRESEKKNNTHMQIVGFTTAERFESVKKILKEFDEEKITKQQIITILDQIKENKEAYSRALSMLKQPSVSVKYVLEYVASNL